MESDVETPLLPSENASAQSEQPRRSRVNKSYDDGGPSIIQWLTFGWVNQMLFRRRTFPCRLEQNDLPALPQHAAPKLCGDLLWNMWQKELAHAASSHRNPSLLRTVFQCFGWPFLTLGILKIANDALNFAGPILLNDLLHSLDNNDTPMNALVQRRKWGSWDVPSRAWLLHHGAALEVRYAALLVISMIIKSFLNAHFTYRQGLISARLRAALTSIVFRQTLHLTQPALAAAGHGRVQTLMSVDADRVLGLCIGFHDLYSLPLQIGLALWLLYSQVELTCVVGLGLVAILIVINRILASVIQRASVAMMNAKDERLSVITELLRGFKAIKAACWEPAFAAKVDAIRHEELRALAVKKYTDALCVYLWAATSLMFSVGTFGLYAVLGKPLSAEVIFTSLALFGVLLGPINSFPWVLNGIVEAFVSMGRLQVYMMLAPGTASRSFSIDFPSTLEQEKVLYVPPLSTSTTLIQIHGSFAWRHGVGPSASAPLRDIDLAIPSGCFLAITGPVGSGKSSLISALLGELHAADSTSSVVWDPSVRKAYAAQDPWIMSGTFKENILIGAHVDNDRYRDVVHACALAEDLKNLAAGDAASVGDRGAALSGGQRARLALARALYRDADIYLFDDVLASVDGKVASWILEHALLQGNLVLGKTVVIVSHTPAVLERADIIVTMDKGTIVSTITRKDRQARRAAASGCPIDAISVIADPDAECTEQDEEEERAVGHVEWAVYRRYLKASRPWVSATLLSLALMQTSRNGSDLWLTYWASQTSNDRDTSTAFMEMLGWLSSVPPDISYYLYILLLMAALNSIFTLARAFAFAQGGLAAARRLHVQLLAATLAFPAGFLDGNRTNGRTLNRFSSDTTTADDTLPFIGNIFLAQAFGLLGVAIILCVSQPYIAVAFVVLVPWYAWLSSFYRHSSRDLRRLDAVAKSPVYCTFSAALDGGVSIRAFNAEPFFLESAHHAVAAQQRAALASLAASSWLGLRLQLIAAVLAAFVCGLAIAQENGLIPASRYSSSAGAVGLGIAYTLPITGLLNSLLTSGAETEQEMVAIERIGQFLDAAVQDDTCAVPPARGMNSLGWRPQGSISISDVWMRYSPNRPFVLKGLTAHVDAGVHVGICGRTGAGKSSIMACLLRMVDPSAGIISLDGINIRSLPAKQIRNTIGYVPQTPFVFSGTVRENVDPLNEHGDDDIIMALHTVGMHAVLLSQCAAATDNEHSKILELRLVDGGVGLSQGQQQLLCLARLVMRRPRLICLDEASAAVDPGTAEAIKDVVSRRFKGSTVIEIAHRLSSMVDCDVVWVIEDGRVAESGPPGKLANDDASLFAGMLRDQGMNGV